MFAMFDTSHSQNELVGVRHSPIRSQPLLGSIAVGSALAVALPTALLLASALTGIFWQQQTDYPIVGFLNTFARRFQLFDHAMHTVTTLVLLQGALLVALIWYLWFAHPDVALRGRLVAGTLAASLAGAASRVLQLVLPSHFRPMHTPELHFELPIGVEPNALNHFYSFPSDHGVLFFGLSAVIYRLNPKLGIAAFVWATIIDLARIYEGYHFPSDIIGALGFGLLMAYLAQTRPVHRLACRVLTLERNYRPAFYMVAFLATYQIATLFDDVRVMGAGFASAMLHHGPFIGG